MRAEDIEAMIAPTVTALGCELWGVQLIQSKHTILRVFIDTEAGANIEDCEKVSRQISQLLDVEDPIRSEYTLEVSTPGMDRPLFKLEQFARYQGEQISLRLRVPHQGQRNFKGLLCGVEGEAVVLRTDDDTEILLAMENIEKANVIPQFTEANPKRKLKQK